MNGRQLRMVITEPARQAGSSVDADLVDTLLREVTAGGHRSAWEKASGGVSGLRSCRCCHTLWTSLAAPPRQHLVPGRLRAHRRFRHEGRPRGWPGPVGFQNSAPGADLGLCAARSYSLVRPPRTGWRWIRSWVRSAAGWSGWGGRADLCPLSARRRSRR